ncbi:MAG: GWxTD domain-containing protein [Chrysiogenales bacterium]
MKTSALIMAIFWLLGCDHSGPRSEPGLNVQDDFFPQARLIMTKDEVQIYTHLADGKARDEFIVDFWGKRDPQPASEENEFKEEFTKRVEFANRWFHEKGPAANGWDSERGRILLILGFPDQREQMPMLDNPRVKAAEIWIYNNYALRLEFLDYEGVGKFRLDHWPLELLDAIEQVKELGGVSGAEKNYFRFKATADASGLLIEIPVKYVMVEERGDGVHTAFTVTADVYCEYVKIEKLSLTHEFNESRAVFTKRKNIAIAVPYTYLKPGKYFLDVTVEEMVTRKRFREFAKFRQAKKN